MFNYFKKHKEKPFEVKLPDTGLNEENFNPYSSTWLFLKTWITSELAKTRELNDYKKNDEIATAMLRGRIKLLKELLELPGKVNK